MIIEYLRYCHPWIPLRCDPAKLFHDGQNIRLLIFSEFNNHRMNFIDTLKLSLIENMQQPRRIIEAEYIARGAIIGTECGLNYSGPLIAAANFTYRLVNLEFEIGHFFFS